MVLLKQSINKISQIDKKELKNKFVDNMVSLTQSINKISQIDKKEPKNKFIDNMRSIDKISQATLIKKFPNTNQFCNGDLNKFALLLRKGVYPYEYMDSWKKFSETSLPNKESFYSEVNKEGINDEDYAHAQKVWQEFNIKNLGEYPVLYVQNDTFLLADVFENFGDKCIEIYELDPAHFLSAPGLAWQASLKKKKKNGVKLEVLTDNDMPLMVEKGIRGGICHAVYRYAKADNKYMTNYDKNKESSFLQYLDTNNQYGWSMCEKKCQQTVLNGQKKMIY